MRSDLSLDDFVQGLLHFYHMQLHDLYPNSMLHLACFVTLCECFLGLVPLKGLWKHLFFCVASTSEEGQAPKDLRRCQHQAYDPL